MKSYQLLINYLQKSLIKVYLILNYFYLEIAPLLEGGTSQLAHESDSNSDDNSGLQVAVDFNFLKELAGRNLDSLVRNRTLVNSTGISIKKDGIFGYDIFFANILLDTLRFPSEISVDPHVTSGLNTVTLTLKNLMLSLLVDYRMKVIGISDSGTKAPVNITLSQLKAEFNFDASGQINFKQFQFDLGKLDIKLNSIIYKAVFWLLKSFVISAIKDQETAIKSALITMIGGFVTKPALIDVGFGIGFNVTNIERPRLDFYSKLSKPNQRKTLQFLSKEKTISQTAAGTTSTMIFGVHASMYPNQDPSIKPDIQPAPKMSFSISDKINRNFCVTRTIIYIKP